MSIKLRIASSLAAFMLTTSLVLPNALATDSSPFTDIDGSFSWAAPNINKLYSMGIASGEGNGKFQPAAPVTRAEFSAFLVRILHYPEDAAATFADTGTTWARGDIGALKYRGIVHGDGNTFSPDSNITRAEMAIMIDNLLKLPAGGSSNFSDLAQSSPDAVQAVNAVYQAGIIQGDPDTGQGPTFRPNDPITRAEAATVLVKMLPQIPTTLYQPSTTHEVLGFTSGDYAGDTYSLQSVKSYSSHLNEVATFSYGIDAAGKVNPLGINQSDTVNAAVSSNVKPYVLISNYVQDKGFDAKPAAAVLQSPALRQTLEQNILTAVEQGNYRGVNIDFEELDSSVRTVFPVFLNELHALLAPKGYPLSVDVYAITTDTVNWYPGYDLKSIGTACDQVIIMGYDYHWAGGDAGPIAPIGWVDQSLQYATSQIPKEKLLLGIGTFGYDWCTVGSTVNTQVILQKSTNPFQSQGRYDAYSDEYTATYRDSNGYTHTVWYGDENTAARRVDLARTYQIAGIAIWRLGFENGSFWNQISSRMGH